MSDKTSCNNSVVSLPVRGLTIDVDASALPGGDSALMDFCDIKLSLSRNVPLGFMNLGVENGILQRASYPEAWARIEADMPTLTDDEWQAQVTTQGSCLFFSTGDGSSTFRIPLVRDLYPRAANPANGNLSGMWMGDAIREMQGSVLFATGTPNISVLRSSNGVFESTDTAPYGPAQGGTTSGVHKTLTFKASKVVPTADEVRPVSGIFSLFMRMYRV